MIEIHLMTAEHTYWKETIFLRKDAHEVRIHDVIEAKKGVYLHKT